MHDARASITDDHCRVGGIGHQGQATQVLLLRLLPGSPLRDVGSDLQDMHHPALGIHHR
jgi:hypothetical protein